MMSKTDTALILTQPNTRAGRGEGMTVISNLTEKQQSYLLSEDSEFSEDWDCLFGLFRVSQNPAQGWTQ